MHLKHLKIHWPAVLSVLIVIPLYELLPSSLIQGLGPRWIVPAIEALLALVLVVNPSRSFKEERDLRILSFLLIGLINFSNAVNVFDLVHLLLKGSNTGGRTLIYASFPIWLTNVIVFGLWYWELDGGGPYQRSNENQNPEFLFPQMNLQNPAMNNWVPGFFDYLYVAFTNATAFSPTDTMPLSKWAKVLMMVQSLISLITVGLVISRAVNIL